MKRKKSQQGLRQGLSAYEQQRLDNIARNQRVLQELGLVEPILEPSRSSSIVFMRR